MHTRGVRGGIKVYPHSKIFAKLVNKNAIKHQKGVPSPQNFYNRYIPSLPPKIWQKPHGPSLRIFKPCASMPDQKMDFCFVITVFDCSYSTLWWFDWVIRKGLHCEDRFRLRTGCLRLCDRWLVLQTGQTQLNIRRKVIEIVFCH